MVEAANEYFAGRTRHAAPPKAGRYDLAILRELQSDARLSNAELASRIGLSAAPTWRRVKWLEQQGYITGYRAEIDRRKIGLGVLAFVRVDAERNNADATKALEDAIRARKPTLINAVIDESAGTESGRITSLNTTAKKK